MMRALWSASTGMNAQQLNIDNISNNLANVNTAGYKKNRLEFQDLLYETIRSAGNTQAAEGQNPIGIQVGQGVRSSATQRIFKTGPLNETGNPYNLAIRGEGFFMVETPFGEAFTRDGSFKIDGEGNLVNTSGYFLSPGIQIDEEASEIVVGTNGSVSYRNRDTGELEESGDMIEVYRFVNAAGLESKGGNLFMATQASGESILMDEGQYEIEQGFVEGSNVQVVEEMVNMIVAQRAYEINSKAIQTSDEMLGIANNLRR